MTATRTSRSGQDDGSASFPPRELRLLPAWPKPLRVFTENLSDCIHWRVVPAVQTSSEPDHGFWRDIDIQSPFPRHGLMDSLFVHAALLGLLYAVSIWPQARVHLADSRSYRTTQNTYLLSPYVPELHGAPTHHRHWGKADPVPARQEVRSLPDEPDNLRQTIVAPPRLKLPHDVELPNLVAYEVAYEPAPPKQPLDASSHSAPPPLQLKPLRALPNFQPSVVLPAPSANLISRKSAPNLGQLLPPGPAPALPAPPQMPVVKPAPEIVQLKPPRALPNLKPTVVQPAPEIGAISRKNAPTLTQILPPGPAPVLPALPGSDTRMPQVVALSAHPAEVQAPVAIPEGNRRGAFAASSAGHPDATGTPGAAASSGLGAHDATPGVVNAPAGISVGASLPPAAVIAAPGAPSHAADPELRSKLLAAMRPSPIASIPPRQPLSRETSEPRSELENHIFAGRRSYTLVVNMPNLNSSVGSWIIRYVDRGQGSEPLPIAAPEVVRKSDPAYPGELIHDGVEGTVILTAIIRADGSVSDIAVAKSLNPQLDENAVQALSRWVFRPALKDGQAIDLEAVIMVPFRTKKAGF